jgi:regulator of protease activity HflC (stomatin/prohibitin superfamily)
MIWAAYRVPAVVTIALELLEGSVKILSEYERAVAFTLGRFQRVRGPGLVLLASQTLVNAAKILASIPAAMPLRYLQTLRKIGQTLKKIGAEQNSTVVYPMPIDIIKPFLELMQKTGKSAGANGVRPAGVTDKRAAFTAVKPDA